MNRRTLLKALAAGIGISAIAGGGGYAWWREHNSPQSDRILEGWGEAGRGKWLIPNLRNAKLVVPDRPHSKDEAMQAQVKGMIGRTRSCRVNSNAHRQRGSRPFEAKQPGTKRWLAIGDSVTFGWGVEDEESWPAQLEAQLREQGHAVELINYGVPAQRIDAMADFLRNVAPGLDLDAVLLAERPEGNVRNYAKVLRGGMQGVPGMPLMLVLPPISRFDPFGRNNWEREVRELRAELPDVPVFDATAQLWEAQRGRGGADMEVVANTLRLLVDGQVLVEATRPQFDLPASFYAAFEDDPQLKEPLFFDEGHPDAEGFGVLVQHLIPELERQRWLP